MKDFFVKKSCRTKFCKKKNQFVNRGTLNFLVKMLLFCREKKLVKLGKLHHDKTIKWDFFALIFENGTLGHKISTFLHEWQASGTILKVVQKSPVNIFFYIFFMK